VKKINSLVNKFMRDPEFQAKVNADGMFTPANNTPEDVTRYIESEIKFWDTYRRKHNIPKVN